MASVTVVPEDIARRGAAVINLSGHSLDQVGAAIAGQGQHQSLVDALTEWHREATRDPRRPKRSRYGDIYDRDKYLTPGDYFTQVRLARRAVADDDVVGNAADITEALAVRDAAVSCRDRDEDDIWNQIVADIALATVLKQAWRTTYSDSACVMATMWGHRTYRVRGEGPGGAKRRREVRLQVPMSITTIDTLKVVPVGSPLFGRQRLAYLASPEEAMIIDHILEMPRQSNSRMSLLPVGRGDDELLVEPDIIRALITSKYQPNMRERVQLPKEGVKDLTRMYLMNSRNVVRHTRTKRDDQIFPEVRLKPVFALVDLKEQLRQADRAVMIGAAKYLLLITKGTDQHPAAQQEVDSLRANAAQMAEVGAVVGDHRVKVEIIQPSADFTLAQSKWNTLDSRIYALAWNSLVPSGTETDKPIELGRVIGAGLQTRRQDLATTIESWLFQQIRDRNDGKMIERAELEILPFQVALEFDKDYAAAVQNARDHGEVSRRTYLGVMELDQHKEAHWLDREREEYDESFHTHNPFGPQAPGMGQEPGDDPGAAPNPGTNPGTNPNRRARQRSAGRQLGGNNNGGGAAPGTGQGQSPRRLRTSPRERMSVGDDIEDTLGSLSRDELIDEAGEWDIKGRHQMRKAQLVDEILDAMPSEPEEPVNDDE